MSLLHIAGGATEDKLYPEDVFVSYLRTGTGADVTVTTGIDYTKGYMVWTKGRSGATDHAIYDSARGVTKDLVSNSTSAETTQTTGLKSVSTTGHTIGSLAKMNTSGATYVDWVFKKAPKFFDVVTYTGNSVLGRQIPHSLGCEVGMIIVKRTNIGSGWTTRHRLATGELYLNNTSAQLGSYYFITGMDSTTFTLGSNGDVNGTGSTYVAYLFATLAGVSKVGSYTGNGSSQTINCGFSAGARFVLSKAVSTTGNWNIGDSVRGLTSGTDPLLCLNTTAAEVTTDDWLDPSAEGFIVNETASAHANTNGVTYIYLAIA